MIAIIGIARDERGGGGGKIERARPQRRNANARPPGQPSMRGRHEAGRLLVPRQDQLDPRGAQRLHDVEIFLAGDAENPIHALVLQGGDEEVRALCHCEHPCQAALRSNS